MRGSVRQLVLFDVADEIRLSDLASALNIAIPERAPVFSKPAPDYVRFERPPVIEPVKVDGFDAARLKYYAYGVASVEFDQRFDLGWEELAERSARWLADPSILVRARELLRPRIEQARAAVLNPYANWIDEDYAMINVEPSENAADLIANCGGKIAQIVRGDNRPLSAAEVQEILSTTISYYPCLLYTSPSPRD